MKLFIAALATETNTFSPIPTGRLSFEDGLVTREATRLPANLFTAPLIEWRASAEARGWEVVEGLCAVANTAGVTLGRVYEDYRDQILADIAQYKPDICLLSMHGAMVAEGYDDTEGDLIARARSILGPDAVLGVELDPHANITQQMMDNATVLIAYKEYPHIDSPERARELFAIAADAAEGKIQPVMAMQDTGMLTLIETMKAPVDGFVQAMKDAEGQDGVLSLSLIHGFPWTDVADQGTRMLAVVDADRALAQKVATDFADRLWDMREGMRLNYPDIAEALDVVEAAKDGPVVLADMADNAGAGASADSTFFLRAVLDRGMRDIAFGVFWDPVLVKMCQDAGVGARLRVRVGGKVCEHSGDPVDMEVIVRAMRDDMTQKLGETEVEMGTGVWLEGTGEAQGLHVILSSTRTQSFAPTSFTDLGVDIASMKALIVKSMNHFYAAFLPVASQVLHVCSPGTATPDMSIIPLTKRDHDYWPRVEIPAMRATSGCE